LSVSCTTSILARARRSASPQAPRPCGLHLGADSNEWLALELAEAEGLDARNVEEAAHELLQPERVATFRSEDA
jgi:hypothetical protein